MTFSHDETPYCPICSPTFYKKRPEVRTGQLLECDETNYSGCGVDIASCPKCGNRFQISYKIDEITKIK